ncbi:MAG: chorismate mutase [Bacteroidia bacterium]
MDKNSEILISTKDSINSEPLNIFGPCSAESREQVLETARQIAANFPNAIFRSGIWKPRTRPGMFEGVGEQGLEWLQEVKSETGLKVITEVASPAHLNQVLKAGIDMVWIGARTTVSPFSVQELAEAIKGVDIPVFVKNPVNPDLGLWMGAIERFKNSGVEELYAIHRGFHSYDSSPYRNSPRWEIVIDLKTQMPDIPVICDVSHISGTPELIATVAQKAFDLDYQGLMVETHINPEIALSDAKQQITPTSLHYIYNALHRRSVSTNSDEMLVKLIELRSRVDSVDDAVIQLLSSRKRLVEEIGKHKREFSMTIFQLKRWEEILERQLRNGQASDLSPEFIKQVYEVIHTESIRLQHNILNVD